MSHQSDNVIEQRLKSLENHPNYHTIKDCFDDLVPCVIEIHSTTTKLNEIQTYKNAASIMYRLQLDNVADTINLTDIDGRCQCYQCYSCEKHNCYTKQYVQNAFEASMNIEQFNEIFKCCYKYVKKIINHEQMLLKLPNPYRSTNFWFLDICCEKYISFANLLCGSFNFSGNFQHFFQRYATHIYKDGKVIFSLVNHFDDWNKLSSGYNFRNYDINFCWKVAQTICNVCEYSNKQYVYVEGSYDELNSFLANMSEKQKASLYNIVVRVTNTIKFGDIGFLILIYHR